MAPATPGRWRGTAARRPRRQHQRPRQPGTDPARRHGTVASRHRPSAAPARPPGYPCSHGPIWADTELLELTGNGKLLSFHRVARPDLPGRPGAPAGLAGAVPQPRGRRVRGRGVHRVAVFGPARRYVQRGRRCPLGMVSDGLGTAHNQSASRKARSLSPGWNRAGVGPGSVSRARTASFAARSASRYWCVTAGLEWPSHKAMTARSVPDSSRCTAVECRRVWGEMCCPRSDGHCCSAVATARSSRSPPPAAGHAGLVATVLLACGGRLVLQAWVTLVAGGYGRAAPGLPAQRGGLAGGRPSAQAEHPGRASASSGLWRSAGRRGQGEDAGRCGKDRGGLLAGEIARRTGRSKRLAGMASTLAVIGSDAGSRVAA